MSNEISLHIVGGLDISKISTSIRDDSKKYFSDLYENLAYRITQKKDVVLSEVFHILVGCKILNIKFDKEMIKKFIDSCKYGEGYLPTNKTHSLYSIIETGNKQEDIYSTYYALMGLSLVGEVIKSNFNLSRYKQESNLIYNYNLSETIEERRLHSEIFISNLLAIKLAAYFNIIKSDEFLDNSNKIMGCIKDQKYLSLILYSCEIIYILEQELPKSVENHIANFIKSHFDDNIGGFFEYDFEDVKRDEIRGRLQRFAHDVRVPSISATYAAIQVSQITNIKPLKDLVFHNKEKIKQFIQNSQSPNTKGFGTEIKIAKMPGYFGNKSTPWETLMAIKSLEILNSF